MSIAKIIAAGRALDSEKAHNLAVWANEPKTPWGNDAWEKMSSDADEALFSAKQNFRAALMAADIKPTDLERWINA